MKIERQRKNILWFFFFKIVLCSFLFEANFVILAPFETSTCTNFSNLRTITAL